MRFVLITQLLLFFLGCAQNPSSPNIIIIFTDDQGYGDLGCYGAEGFETPNIDKMADEGMLFTDFYVSQAVCSASRASLMTGSYAERVGIQGALSPWNVTGLDPSKETIAKILKRRGYTNAIFGKWHLGHREKYLPLQNGFDEYAGLICSNDMWPVDYDGKPLTGEKKSYYPPMSFWEGNQPSEKIETLSDQGQITNKITSRAVDFINRNRGNPFFLYIPHPMPHQPIAASDKFLGKSELGLYGDVIMEIDWSVGEIIKALKKNNIDKNTLIIYASDNGPWLNYGEWGGSAGPLREGKGSMWEGGARVPCIMRWPGKIKPGQIIPSIASTIDILPTIAEISGQKNIKNRFLPRFSQIAFLAQMPHMNIEEEVEKIKGEPLTGSDKKEIKLRVEYANNWLKVYAPENYKYELQEDSIPKEASNLSNEQKQVLGKVLEYVKSERNLDGQELHSKIHEIRKESDIEPKELFSAIYLSFLGKESGPKAGWFLSVLDKGFLEKRLEEVTK